VKREETVSKYLILLDREPFRFREEDEPGLFAGLDRDRPFP
jgi:hypothetical protein